MTTFLLVIAAIIFFYLFDVKRDKQGMLQVKRHLFDSQNQKKSGKADFRTQWATMVKSKSFMTSLTVLFVLAEVIVFTRLANPVETLITVRASQLLPQKFEPIARFAANIDWESKTVALDASMSKAYEDKITNYIWRIDDGTSLVGSQTLEHTFVDPGYYYIQLSVVDADNQSDVATCQILIPPSELEQVPTHERLTENEASTATVRDVDYDWAPKGTFFNYSKLGYNDRSYANLKSHYIESGCGYSNRSYNVYKNNYVDFLHDERVQSAMISILRTLVTGVAILPILFLVARRLFKKSAEK